MIRFNQNLIACGLENGSIKFWSLKIFKIQYSCFDQTSLQDKEVRNLVQIRNEVIAEGQNDFNIRLYNVTSNKKVISTLTGHTSYINALVLLYNGDLESGSHDKMIIIWSMQTYKCINKLVGHSDGIKCLIQLPNKQLVSGSFDKTIKLWEFPNAN